MCIRYFGFLLIWYPDALHAQNALQSCSAPRLDDGFLSQKQVAYSHGTMLSYTCNDGLKPVVKGWWATTTCENGKWSHQPQCIDINACIPPTIPNGNYTENSNGWYEEGHIIRIRCEQGYEHRHRIATTRCIRGQWSSLPICEKSITACGQPPKVSHAVIIHQGYQEVFPADSEVQYKCEDGYATEEASSSESIFCIAGNWTEAPMCRLGSNGSEIQTQTTINNCGIHPTVENGDVVETADMFLRFRCNSFYRQVGPEKVMCFTDGTWSEIPMCEAAFCSLDTTEYPDLIPDGIKFIKDGDRVELKCVKKHWRWVSDHYSLVQCVNGTVELTRCCGYFDRSMNTCWGSMTKFS